MAVRLHWPKTPRSPNFSLSRGIIRVYYTGVGIDCTCVRSLVFLIYLCFNYSSREVR